MKKGIYEIFKSQLLSLYSFIVDGVFSGANKTYKKSIVNKFSRNFFNLKSSSWAVGEAETVNIISKKRKIDTKQFFKPEVITESSLKLVKEINNVFQQKDYSVINKRVFEKLYNDSIQNVSVAYAETEEKINRILKEFGKANISASEAKKKIKALGFSEGYAQNIFRTNVATSYNKAKYQRAVESNLIGGFRYISNSDNRTRKNHHACKGLEQEIESEWWDYLYPPLGYQCRCLVLPIMTVRKHVPAGLSLPAIKNSGSRGYADYRTFGKRPKIL